MLLFVIIYVLIFFWGIYLEGDAAVWRMETAESERKRKAAEAHERALELAKARRRTTTNITYVNIDKAIIMKGDENGSNNFRTIRRN